MDKLLTWFIAVWFALVFIVNIAVVDRLLFIAPTSGRDSRTSAALYGSFTVSSLPDKVLAAAVTGRWRSTITDQLRGTRARVTALRRQL